MEGALICRHGGDYRSAVYSAPVSVASAFETDARYWVQARAEVVAEQERVRGKRSVRERMQVRRVKLLERREVAREEWVHEGCAERTANAGRWRRAWARRGKYCDWCFIGVFFWLNMSVASSCAGPYSASSVVRLSQLCRCYFGPRGVAVALQSPLLSVAFIMWFVFVTCPRLFGVVLLVWHFCQQFGFSGLWSRSSPLAIASAASIW